MKWYIKVLKQYSDFSGRAGRKEYWMFVLFNTIFIVTAMLIDNVLGTTIGGMGYGFFYVLYTLAVFVPAVAVCIRRLHDTGRSGWYFLVAFIPVIGGIWLLVLMVLDSRPGENRYGPNPKGVTA